MFHGEGRWGGDGDGGGGGGGDGGGGGLEEPVPRVLAMPWR